MLIPQIPLRLVLNSFFANIFGKKSPVFFLKYYYNDFVLSLPLKPSLCVIVMPIHVQILFCGSSDLRGVR